MAKFKVGDLVRLYGGLKLDILFSEPFSAESVYTVNSLDVRPNTTVYDCTLLFGQGPMKLRVLGTYMQPVKKPLGGEGQDASGGRGMGEEKQPDRTT